ncbi:DUF1178 family protein [Oricola cellulosilytica]|uniref:DUF1178 family protein n=1 Tax=Oricola cellulosilytica TaxID=1429082 RepID=A0A4R0P952_9HYPH|nr:DUF1178 family protein [Oricola cellulosilytica]TCD13709.1 DUF1178 family protein [Oricola cellulosilytica]
MIKFSLVCDGGHEFEGWFKNSADFDTQSKRGFLECPACGSSRVSKALMAPNVAGTRHRDQMNVVTASPAQPEIIAKMRDLARLVREQGENVGSRFAEEARKIHFGETEARGIYGKATAEEVSGLLDDGVDVMPLPDLPEDLN